MPESALPARLFENDELPDIEEVKARYPEGFLDEFLAKLDEQLQAEREHREAEALERRRSKQRKTPTLAEEKTKKKLTQEQQDYARRFIWGEGELAFISLEELKAMGFDVDEPEQSTANEDCTAGLPIRKDEK
jgi:hypothetical protein